MQVQFSRKTYGECLRPICEKMKVRAVGGVELAVRFYHKHLFAEAEEVDSAEVERIGEIKKKIEEIEKWADCTGLTSAEISSIVDSVKVAEITSEIFEEFVDGAKKVAEESLALLQVAFIEQLQIERAQEDARKLIESLEASVASSTQEAEKATSELIKFKGAAKKGAEESESKIKEFGKKISGLESDLVLCADEADELEKENKKLKAEIKKLSK